MFQNDSPDIDLDTITSDRARSDDRNRLLLALRGFTGGFVLATELELLPDPPDELYAKEAA